MKYRRLLSFVLAMLMVVSLMPVSVLAAGSKKSVENVQQTATIGGKSVKVQLKGVPSDTKLKIGGAKKASYYNAVKGVVKDDFTVVLAMNVRVNPSLKKAVPVTVTASAIKGLKASGVRLFNVADGKAREIKSFRISDKDLKFEAKAFDTLVLVKPVPVQPETPAPTAEPTQEPEVTAEPTEEPEITPEPTEEPEITPEPTEEPEVTPEPTEEPEVTPEPTEEPEVTPEPTEEPEVTPEPTEEPEVTPEPTEEPEVTPEPTEEPEVTPEPTEEPEVTPEPTEEPKVPTELEKTVDNVTVRVVAPAGVLPEGTWMEVETASVKNVQAMVDRNDKINGTVLLAVDITFKVGEGEDAIVVQPSDEVKVSITSADMADVEDPFVVHVVDENTLEKIEPEDGALAMTRRGTRTVTFSARSFSVYALVWEEEEVEKTATVHFGTSDETGFHEFSATTITFDTTASTINLAITHAGYSYRSARYQASETDETISMASSILYKTETGWAADLVITGEGESQTVTRTPIADGSHIYVTYYQPTTPPGPAPTPEPGEEPTIPSPTTTKTVEHNPDGTYTIQLDIAGATLTEDNSHYVNVLVILDATTSMSGAKWTNAKAAMNTLIETMTEGDNAANAGKIDFALVTFGRSATVTQGWTKDNAAFKTTCAGLNMVNTSGTNWEAGMRGGYYGVLNNLPDDDPLYVIFLTDGDPNTYYFTNDDIGYSYWGSGAGGSRWNPITVTAADVGATNIYSNDHMRLGYGGDGDTSADRSKDEVRAITGMGAKLYGIYCFAGDTADTSSASYTRLDDVIRGQGQGGQKTIAATASTIQSEFKAIAETALSEVGANNVGVDDGIPSLSSISSAVAGEAGGYEYFKGTKAQGATEITWTPWTDAPGATYSNDNGVTWDLSKYGSVKEGDYFRLRFTVWPSQEAYDLIADLNNGLETRTEEELDALGIAKDENTGIYYLLTNTHLNTFYTFNNQSYSDSPDEVPTEEMILPTTTIKVVKYWNNDLDDRAALENATIIVTKDGATYKEVALGKVTQISDHRWKQTPAEEIYISMGQLTLNTSTNVIKVISSGHEYTVKEPSEYSHNWWLTAEVYHPMLVNGVPTVLVELKEDDIPASLKNLANNMHAVDGGKDYYKFDNNLYVAQAAGENLLEATNDRRSHLNITKAVTGEGAPADAYFTFTATVTDSEGKDVWFSVATSTTGSELVMDENIVTGATREIEDGSPTGYWSFASGGTVTIKIKAGWNIRFINLPNGSEYEIVEVESAMEPGWVFKAATSSAVSDYNPTPATINQATATGTIDQANSNYSVTYTNEYLGVFYVYHSSDCSVEQIPMADKGVPYSATHTFDIYAKTLTGTLYGGYFTDYLGKSKNFDAAKLTYTDGVGQDALYDADDNPNGAYTYSLAYIKTSEKAAWNSGVPYTTSGIAMVPVKNTVYYLKEVPQEYLLPYTYYTYYKTNNKIADMWTISALDDLNYTGAGFYIQEVQTGATSVVNTLSIRAANSTTTVKLTAFKLFAVKGMQDGYLSYLKITDKVLKSDGTGNEVLIWQYWTTPDSIEVFGVKNRTIDATEETYSYKGEIVNHVEDDDQAPLSPYPPNQG